MILRNVLAVGLVCGAAMYAPTYLWATSPEDKSSRAHGRVTGRVSSHATGRAIGRVSSVSGDLIFDNVAQVGGLNLTGGSPASQYDDTFPFDAGAVDDFVLPPSTQCAWTITGVRWSGVNWATDDTAAVTGFRIIFWPDAAGFPAGGGGYTPDMSQALAVYDIPGSADETPRPGGSLLSFDYSTDLPEPFQALPGVRYWIEIQPVMPFPPQWGWQVTQSRQGSGPVAYFDLLGLAAWTPINDPGDLAFQLMGAPRDIVCDDGNACTENTCVDGVCVFTPMACDDSSECTTDTCDPATGCVFSRIACDDTNACTTDSCDAATGCVFADVTCDDGDACTTDACDPATGCVFSPITCDDQEPCTADTCEDGACVYTSPADFDGDSDVDHEDFKLFHACMTGTTSSTQQEVCPCVDLNGDGRTDILDYAAFQRAFTGGL